MLRWAPGFVVAAVIAVLVGLLETVVAVTGLQKNPPAFAFGPFTVTSLADELLQQSAREGRAFQ